MIVDIAFRFKDPEESLMALLQVVDSYPRTRFLVLDHHELKRPTLERSNLSLVEADSVFQCCFGTPSDDLMIVAAICDRDEGTVRHLITEAHRKRADGIRRAAADIDGVAGSVLLSLLKRGRWSFFEKLAEEPSESHKRARGRRTSKSHSSPLLKAAISGLV